MHSRKLCLCFLGATLATSGLTTGCRFHHHDRQDNSQPAQNETVIYNKWEVDTHRAHKDINQRPPEEQKEYRDWRQKQPDNH
jgi:hypothetical protein